LRLHRLSIRNFKAFVEADVEFEPATVLVGANDSGKSALLDAIHWIFSEFDRTGDVFSRAGHSFRQHQSSRPGDDWAPAGPMIVKATFVDLSPNEAAVWAPALDGGRITFGRRLDDEDESGELHLVVDEATYKGLARFEAARPNAVSTTLALEELGDILFEPHDGEYWMSLDTFGDLIASGEVTFWSGSLPDPFSDFPSPANVVVLRGPESGAQSPANVLKPIIARAVHSKLIEISSDPDELTSERDDLTRFLIKSTRAVIEDVSKAYSRALPKYTARAGGAMVYQQDSSSGLTFKLIDQAIGELGIDIASRHIDGSAKDDDIEFLADNIEDAGAGTRHAAALAALELFRDETIWPIDQSVLLLVEEPEMGLHPAAQRQVVAALRDLPTFGVQLVVVTHAPTFVNAVAPEGLRLVKSAPPWTSTGLGSSVVLPTDLREIASELGVTPADVLLGRRFLVVEGTSDAAILSQWARRGGRSFDDAGVKVVPAHGHGTAPQLARFLEIAYEGASFWVVLDQGRETDRTKREMEARFGDRVVVRLLARHEIEAYLPAVAVERWLESQGHPVGADERSEVGRALSSSTVKSGLRALTEKYLGRAYRVVEDGTAIAGLTRESEVPQELRDLLIELVDD
jgi:hypothetical protein